MKIVFLQDDFPPESLGGAGFSTYELARGMYRAGHEIFVITTCRKQEKAGECEHDGIKIFTIASDYNPNWRAYVSLNNIPVVRAFEKKLNEIQPDVVHINNIHTHLSYRCFKIAQSHGCVVVFTPRDTMPFTYGKLNTQRYLEHSDTHTTWRDHFREAQKGYNPLRNFFIKRYLTYADKIIAVSHTLAEACITNGIRDVGVIHTGADVSEWGAKEEERKTFREKYGLEDKKIILFGGRLSEGKGGKKALKALLLTIKEIPEAILLVAGKLDEYTERMIASALSGGIRTHVVFTGWLERDSLRIAYAIAHVVIVPSVYLDPFPRVVIEAMASGKPVIGSCYGGSPEIIVDGKTGYIVNPLNAEEIAQKTIELLENPGKAKQFGEAGYDRIQKDFNLENKVREYLFVYKILIERKK